MTTPVTGTFGAVGSSAAIEPVTAVDRPSTNTPIDRNTWRALEQSDVNMNLSLSGTFVGTVLVERSFDSGSTYHLVATHTTIVETRYPEAEVGVLYRLRCSIYTSGTVTYRLSA